MQDFESGGPGSIPGRGKCDLDFSPFLLHLVAIVGVAALESDGRSKCWVVTQSLRDICIGMNAYICLVIGSRDVAV